MHRDAYGLTFDATVTAVGGGCVLAYSNVIISSMQFNLISFWRQPVIRKIGRADIRISSIRIFILKQSHILLLLLVVVVVVVVAKKEWVLMYACCCEAL